VLSRSQPIVVVIPSLLADAFRPSAQWCKDAVLKTTVALSPGWRVEIRNPWQVSLPQTSCHRLSTGFLQPCDPDAVVDPCQPHLIHHSSSPLMWARSLIAGVTELPGISFIASSMRPNHSFTPRRVISLRSDVSASARCIPLRIGLAKVNCHPRVAMSRTVEAWDLQSATQSVARPCTRHTGSPTDHQVLQPSCLCCPLSIGQVWHRACEWP